jgi:chromosome segregation ATPase
MQPNYRIPTGGNEQVNAAGLLHMATVMLTVEKEQLNKVVADAELQEAQIEDLSKENAALHDHIKSLSEDNQKLLAKNAGFRTRCEQYKAKMNDVMRIQKELKVDAKNLNRRQFEILAEAGKEMDAELLEAKSQVLKGSRAILKEARLEINRRKVKIGS